LRDASHRKKILLRIDNLANCLRADPAIGKFGTDALGIVLEKSNDHIGIIVFLPDLDLLKLERIN
jgi:hypothetical protein